MVKKGITFFLVILSLLFIFPVVFLAVGSLMGKNELTELLRPVLESGNKGYASWKILPQYPTLKNYVEILLDSPGFFVMFWNSVKITFGTLLGELLVGMPAAWGFAKYDFPVKKILFFFIYHTDDDAISGYASWQLSGAGSAWASGFALGDHPSGGFFYIPRIYYVPLFRKHSPGASGSGKD